MPHVSLNTGVDLFYEQGGHGGETLVFVNGLTMDTTAWGGVESLLAENYSTLRYDCRGQGQSSKPEGPYTPEQHAADLIALLDALELARVHLIGLSNGGLVSALVAGEQPVRVRSLTMIDSFIHNDALLKTILTSWVAALETGGPALRFDIATPWVWGHRFLAVHLDDVLAFRAKAAASDPAAIASLIDGLATFRDARSSLDAYDGPLLALVGADDLLTPPRYSEEIVAQSSNARLEILENAGHAAPVERPEAVAALLETFLEVGK